MTDNLAAHRQLVNTRDVLHSDISQRSTLLGKIGAPILNSSATSFTNLCSRGLVVGQELSNRRRILIAGMDVPRMTAEYKNICQCTLKITLPFENLPRFDSRPPVLFQILSTNWRGSLPQSTIELRLPLSVNLSK